MHRSFVVVVLALGLGCSSSESSVDHKADEQSILETRRLLTRAYNNANIPAILAFYEPGCTYMPQHQAAMDMEGMRAYFTEQFRTHKIHNVIASEKVSWMGDDYAVDVGTYDLTLQQKLGGEALMERGKYLVIWHRQEDGSWKITHDIDNPSAGR